MTKRCLFLLVSECLLFIECCSKNIIYILPDDEMFDDLSEGLVRKKDWMFEKYRSLILEESMVSMF